MRPRLGAPLVLVAVVCSTQLVAALEFHQEHEAEHTTALWRRQRGASAPDDAGRVQVAIGVKSQRMLNVTTKLEDMTSEYTGTIGVGTAQDGGPLFEARVVFDTGSTNLWVASVLCKRFPCTSARARSFYDPDKSKTQERYPAGGAGLGTRDIDITFGTGELRGPLHVDTYRVGPMIVSKQPFAMIREMSGDVFSSFPFEGILGLAFRSLSFGGIEPFFERVISLSLLKHNEFAFYLNADSGRPSALLWGGIDKDLYEGSIRMFPVVQPHYWALELVDFRLGDHSLSTAAGGWAHPLNRLIVDSGTTYFTVPSTIFSRIVAAVPEAPCSEVSKYPPLTYVLRDAQNDTYGLVISQQTYMIADDFDNCRPAFMRLDVNSRYGPAVILGEVFMRHYFTVFSRGDGSDGQARVGFARAKLGVVPKAGSQRPSFLRTEAAPVMMRRAAA